MAHAVLVEKASEAYGGDNSRAEFAAACSLIKAGYGDEAVINLFEKYQPPHYSRKDSEWFTKYVLIKAKEGVDRFKTWNFGQNNNMGKPAKVAR